MRVRRRLYVSTEGWIVLVPVKALAWAKSRLSVGVERRRRLALEFAAHTVSVASSTPQVQDTVVITGDDEVVCGLGVPGISFLPEPVGPPDLNACLRRAVATVREQEQASLAILVADLPGLAGAELAQALDAAAFCDRAVVVDADGTGTTLLTAGRGLTPRPRFGEESFKRHVGRGHTPLSGEWPGLRRDVDVLEDLRVVEEWVL